jgi:hypothetical protein
VNTSRDSCSVQWTSLTPPANTLITGYVVLIDDGLQGTFRFGHDASKDPSKNNATIYGLEAMTTYRLMVYGLNKAGQGTNSS